MTQRHYRSVHTTALLAVGVLFAGCSSTPPASVEHRQHYRQKTASHTPQRANTALEKALYDHYQQWKGVRYRMGGMSKNGVDCSGFVYRTFRDKLGQNLPRTTRMQSRQGYQIKKNDLRTGDLVFFRPDGNKRHVGIYLEDGLFMHASTSIGVTISRLDNRYWRQSYWQSRRIPL